MRRLRYYPRVTRTCRQRAGGYCAWHCLDGNTTEEGLRKQEASKANLCFLQVKSINQRNVRTDETNFTQERDSNHLKADINHKHHIPKVGRRQGGTLVPFAAANGKTATPSLSALSSQKRRFRLTGVRPFASELQWASRDGNSGTPALP